MRGIGTHAQHTVCGFHHVFAAVKQAEYDRFNARVTELDYAWYLRNA